MSVGLAFRAFFATLFNRQTAQRIRVALSDSSSNLSATEAKTSAEPTGRVEVKLSSGRRSDALTLISTLQREARFLDLVQEPLEEYTDAQVGAAARNVLCDTAKTLKRLFAIEKLVSTPEGETIEFPKEPSAARWRFVGPVPSGSRGTLMHAGWQATQCSLPQWTGLEQDFMVFAPAEIEA
ncbi:MAG: DUF2760 domain-containing protein [Pirellulaceae bacterium]|nr:DUF2760 domain-containing protein [Pirellulaceae bacterium]